MAVELVTGYAGTAHVSSSEDGARQAGTVGTGMYVLETVDEPLKATLENANTVTVGPGDVLVNGRHVQLTGSTTFSIPVGTQGQRTSNLLVIRYEVDEDGTESATAITLTGSPSTADPEDPELATGDILAGDSPVDMPLYRVVTTGIETAEPEALFQTIPPIASLPGVFGNVLDVAHGGTGQTSLQAARNAMGLGNTTGALPVANGGTGATSAATARSNLGITPANIGAAASSHNHSASQITSGTLAVARGGTGRTSLTGSSGLLHDLHDNNMTNPDYFSVFSQNWADGGYISKSDLLKLVYPVGAVYVSWSSTSPASLFGGSWTQIRGAYVRFDSNTSTGGSNTHTLTVAEMPSHSHVIESRNQAWVAGGANIATAGPSAATGSWTSGATRASKTGGGGSHSIMPYYQNMYAWRRTA